MKILFNNRKSLYITLSLVIILVFTLTIAYAALNAVLEITGNAEVVASNWDIRLQNPIVNSSSVNNNLPTITSNKEASFSATLNTPGDFYEFTIDVVNNGSIDAMIDSVEKTPTLSSDQAKYLNYIVEYENGNTISSKQLVEANSFVRLKVKVEFRKDLVSTDLPKTNETLNLSFKLNYVQAAEEGTTVIPNSGIPIINFYIDGSPHQAKEGMTWKEWLEGEYYEYGDIYIEDNFVVIDIFDYPHWLTTSNTSWILGDDVIMDGCEYFSGTEYYDE